MAGRDDFSSNMKSPGGWSGGAGSAGGGFGGKSSGSVYGYQTMPGARPNTKAIGNWNTGGAPFGFGTPAGAREALSNMFRPQVQPQAPIQSGPIPPALGPQGLPVDQVPPVTPTSFPMTLPASLSGFIKNPFNRVGQPTPGTPSAPVMSQYGPRAPSNLNVRYDANNPAFGVSLGNFANNGGYSNGPSYSPNVGGFAGGTGGPAMGGGWNYNGGSFGGPR